MNINKIKEGARVVIHLMENHTIKNFPNEDFKDVISKMHNASNADELSKAYSSYINLCLGHNYNEAYILAGIMQNEDKNKEFNVNLDNVLKSIINIKSNSVDLGCLENNEIKDSEAEDKSSPLKGLSRNEIIAYAAEYDPDEETNALGSTNKDMMRGDLLGVTNAKRKAAYELLSKEINNTPDCNKPVKESKKVDKAKDQNIENASVESAPVMNSTEHSTVQQPAVASTVGTGFNINNFITPSKTTPVAAGIAGGKIVLGPNMPKTKTEPAVVNTTTNQQNAQNQQNIPSCFKHKTCGLSDAEMEADNAKHLVSLLGTSNLSVYALYDLIHSKHFKDKMKSLNATDRPNNIKLTEVNINEYIDIPELLAKYPIAFTTPCKDKGKIIVILFNPNPIMLPNGAMQYDMHFIPAHLTNNAGK